MSQSFDVLNRSIDIQRNFFLEASAGTGKTFAIENIYVRLLEEPFKGGLEGLKVDQIAVMTFTKAAARDLRKRIRENIVRKKGENLALQEALYNFDQAHIFTIHGFCNRSLRAFSFESGISFDRSTNEEVPPRQALKQIVHDLFRTQLAGLSKVQVTLLVEKSNYSQEHIENELIELLDKRGSIVPPPPIQELFQHFQKGMETLKKGDFTSLISDYALLAPHLKKGDYSRREQSVFYFSTLLNKERCSFEDFEQLLLQWEFLRESFNPETLNKTKKMKESLVHPSFFAQLMECLGNTMELATNPSSIQAALGAKCQELYRIWENNRQTFTPDKLLEVMHNKVDNPLFAEKIRSRYRAVIVDEFQDTDPIQWEILQRLFLISEYQGLIYLVGDPKQAIYAFRQGDVYTYLDAAKALGKDSLVSLKTNYRSTPSLIKALNTFFGSAKNLFGLPYLNGEIPYHPVESGNEETPCFQDGKGPLHFMEIDKRLVGAAIPTIVYEAIAEAISKLKGKSIAILVSSSSQGEKIAEILKKWNIPSFTQKAPALAKSAIVPALIELLEAVISPRKLSALKAALGGPLMGWTVREVCQLEQLEILENILNHFYQLRKTLFEKGFSTFIQQLLKISLKEGEKSVAIRLLERDKGVPLFQNLMQLKQILTQHQAKTHCPPDGLIAHLKEIFTYGEEGFRQLLHTESHVQILTIHSSKGLEFDVVFAPGILSPQVRGKLSFVADRNRLFYPILNPKTDPLAQKHTEEMDEERMRLLYVALTRAKERVVVPICLDGKGDSPWDLFLRKMVIPFHSLLSENITLEKIKESYQPFFPSQQEVELFPPPEVKVKSEPHYLHSFSSLVKTLDLHGNFLGAPSNLQNSLKTIHTLPSGSEVGNFFHQLFEKIPFNSTYEEIEKILVESIKGTPFKGWENVFAKSIYNTFYTKLPLKTGLKSLSEMGNPPCYREMEFCYPTSEGYIKGVVDLLFFFEDHYYLLDWKSNWLGKDSEAYRLEGLEAAMQTHNYHLQGLVYRNALECYLNRIDPRPFQEIYGGMFYLFFRGMDREDPLRKGIYTL